MNFKWLLMPMLVQIFLTLILLFYLAYLRISTLKNRVLKLSQIALGQKVWPESVTKVDNCFHNQLETPILFYSLILTVGLTHLTNIVFIAGAWIFIFCRLLHALIEIRSNNVIWRFRFFALGSLILLGLWLYFSALLFSAS